MDSSLEAAMCVHRRDGTIMKFTEYKSGLYYYDARPHVRPTEPPLQKPNLNTSQSYLFVQTVANKEEYTKREVEGADRAMRLKDNIGNPSEAFFQTILDSNLVRNNPVTPDDAKRALKIYGPPKQDLQGKTTKRQNDPIPYVAPEKYLHQSLNNTTNSDCSLTFFGSTGTHFFTQSQSGLYSAQLQQLKTERSAHSLWKQKAY